MTTNDYKPLSFSQLCQALEKKARTLIIFHDRPDGDAVGSAFGLRALLSALGSEARCVCSSEVPRRYSFAVRDAQDSVLPENISDDFVPERVISVDTASAGQMRELEGRIACCVDIMIDHHAKGTPFANYCIIPDASSAAEVLLDILDDEGVI